VLPIVEPTRIEPLHPAGPEHRGILSTGLLLEASATPLDLRVGTRWEQTQTLAEA